MKKKDIDPADKLDKQNTGWEARMAWINGKTGTDRAFELEVERSQRMLERLFGFSEEDLK